MTKKELSEKYDHFYERGTDLFKRYDPCKFKDGRCIKNRKGNRTHRRIYDQHWDLKDGCCSIEGDCKHLGPNGCKVKSLGCKLYFCHRDGRENERFHKHIDGLRKEVEGFFGSVYKSPHHEIPLLCYYPKKKYIEFLIRERDRL